MTTVIGDIENVLGVKAEGFAQFWAPTTYVHAGTAVIPDADQVPIVSGSFTTDVTPGRCRVRVVVGSADAIFDVNVPDQDEIAFSTLLEKVVEYEPAVVSEVTRLVDEAKRSVAVLGSAEQIRSLAGEAESAAGRAEVAAGEAESAAGRADSSAQAASASAVAASESASAASVSADSAREQAEAAAASAQEASESSGAAGVSAAAAKGDADRAAGQAEAAESSAMSAAGSADESESSAVRAEASAAGAAVSEAAAEASATSAGRSATEASTHADRAEGVVDTVRWDDDRLTVAGKTSPSLRGPKGDKGLTGDLPIVYSETAPADTSVIWVNPSEVLADAGVPVPAVTGPLTGPGRPDTPSTTGGKVTGGEPVGAEYISTDGAGVGAWRWAKRPTGWVVTDGDTDWRLIGQVTGGTDGVCEVWLRRVNTTLMCHFRFTAGVFPTGKYRTVSTYMSGFTPDVHRHDNAEYGVPLYANIGNGQLSQVGSVGVLTHSANQLFWLVDATTNMGRRTGAIVELPTIDVWPSTLPGTGRA